MAFGKKGVPPQAGDDAREEFTVVAPAPAVVAPADGQAAEPASVWKVVAPDGKVFEFADPRDLATQVLTTIRERYR